MFNSPVTELTTAATDAVLGIVCLALMPALWTARVLDPWKTGVWIALLALLAFAAFLGAVVHGFALSAALRDALWQPLFLALGLVVALFAVGAVRDWLGEAAARRLLVPALVVGLGFWVASRALGGSFLVFVVYEAVAMGASLAIYLVLAYGSGAPGAGTIASAIALTLAAAAIQASTLQVTLVWPFDHNSLFHLVQIAGVVVLQRGLLASLAAAA